MSEARPSGAQPWEQEQEVRVEGAGTFRAFDPAVDGTVGCGDPSGPVGTGGTVAGGPALATTAVSRRHHPLLRLKRRLARI
ncbi:hypothetical protein [Nocardioides sp. TF02-7]|uniref:hypothetical protein n=1 Tax=Nocardioides sp. TF02-7 TaxID=2917724 RepID=UPI001F06D2BB|nr:hypothetical protein [Nocardioides sp. TF02-7]UMG91459.1 hypothetical protein MF408_15130 [Nocardioides sp. TF02-7]